MAVGIAILFVLFIGHTLVAARRAPNAEDEREIAMRSSLLIALASIEAAVLVSIGLGALFVGPD